MADTFQPDGSSTLVIQQSGDLHLVIEDEVKHSSYRFLVSSHRLRNASEYFRNLLDPAKFQEGAHVASSLHSQSDGSQTEQDHTENEFPTIHISDVPNPSTSSLKDIISCFLEITHETSPEGKAGKLSGRKVPMSFITRLAIVADRFLALQAIKPFVDAYQRIQPPSKEAFRLVYSLQNEAYWRQRLLVGIWLGYPGWVYSYSRLLIQHGSEYWSRLEIGEDEVSPSAALWTHIPWGIEEEMMQRRSYVLSTISSLQDFFLDRYLSGKRQCRLGYDSSPQCDSFQLGEMVRFFGRKNLLSLKSSVDGQDWKPSYSGNLLDLLKSLRQCPTYQIDSNHSHCGIRTLLVPRVEFLESWMSDPLHSGICLKCWHTERSEYSWAENPEKELWRWAQRTFLNSSGPLCDRQHKSMKEVFTSEQRDWSPEGQTGT